MPEHNDDDSAQILNHPVKWVAGAAAATVGVIGSVVFDPTGAGGQLALALIQNISDIFTVSSIIGFTVAPSVPQIPEGPVQQIAIASGAIFALIILDGIADSIMERFEDD